MVIMREEARPTEGSAASVEQCAAEILACFGDGAHVEWYFETHKARIGFDLDYAHN